MPHSKSAQKAVRANKRRHLRNKSIRSLCKTKISKAEKLILSGELNMGREAVKDAASVLDRAADKSIIHANNAARRKSRLMRKLIRAETAKTYEG